MKHYMMHYIEFVLKNAVRADRPPVGYGVYLSWEY